MYTPMHRALDRPPSELTYELLEACVATQVCEADDLEWKQALPFHDREGRWQDEWAKDVAAMANTGGGCIVYGVAEEPGTGAASALVDVGPIAEDDVQKRLRPTAAALIHPLVSGLRLIPVTDGSRQALVVLVPDSPDVPHMLRQGREAFKAPFRYGATTEWMTDRMLEDAYRRRFRRGAELEELLTRRYEAAARHAGHQLSGPGAWFVGAAVPVEPQPEVEITADQARDRLIATQDLFRAIHGRPVQTVIYDANTVPGLRRLIAGGPTSGYQIDLHFDGTLTVIEELADAAEPAFGAFAVPSDELERSVVRLVASVAATARAARAGAPYAVRVGLAWQQAGSKPLRLGRHDPRFGHHRVTERLIHEVETSTREVRTDVGTGDLRESARTLALDILRQGGQASTTFIADPE